MERNGMTQNANANVRAMLVLRMRIERKISRRNTETGTVSHNERMESK